MLSIAPAPAAMCIGKYPRRLSFEQRQSKVQRRRGTNAKKIPSYFAGRTMANFERSARTMPGLFRAVILAVPAYLRPLLHPKQLCTQAVIV